MWSVDDDDDDDVDYDDVDDDERAKRSNMSKKYVGCYVKNSFILETLSIIL